MVLLIGAAITLPVPRSEITKTAATEKQNPSVDLFIVRPPKNVA
jgi:hypothetical protein